MILWKNDCLAYAYSIKTDHRVYIVSLPGSVNIYIRYDFVITIYKIHDGEVMGSTLVSDMPGVIFWKQPLYYLE